ncbi:MAG: hypothetical protein Q9168_004648 [Polycauliona sp. 1 TL-2023]
MASAPAKQTPTKRQSEKHDDFSKQFAVHAHAKTAKDVIRYILENEKYHKELQETKDKLKVKTAAFIDLQSENGRLKADLEAYKQRLRNSTKVNGDLTVEVLKRQPMSQLADSQVTDLYKTLNDNISSWVDSEIRSFENQWKKNHDGQYPDTNHFQHGNVKPCREFLEANHKYGGEYLTESQIHLQLHELLFKEEKIFAPLGRNETEFVENFEAGLLLLDPPRDITEIRYLRSEMLKGFTASPAFQERREAWMSKAGVGILRYAEKILPTFSGSEDQMRNKSFQVRVLEPAFDLAIALKTSSVEYVFSESEFKETQLQAISLANYQWNSCSMIDIDTRAIVNKNKRRGKGGNAVGAKRVLLLAPGLARKSGEIWQTLHQEMICVKIDPSGIIDDEIPIKKEEHDPPRISGLGADISSEPPKKKQKGRNAALPIDLDDQKEIKIEPGLDRPQRHAKAPKVYGLYPDHGAVFDD